MIFNSITRHILLSIYKLHNKQYITINIICAVFHLDILLSIDYNVYIRQTQKTQIKEGNRKMEKHWYDVYYNDKLCGELKATDKKIHNKLIRFAKKHNINRFDFRLTAQRVYLNNDDTFTTVTITL